MTNRLKQSVVLLFILLPNFAFANTCLDMLTSNSSQVSEDQLKQQEFEFGPNFVDVLDPNLAENLNEKFDAFVTEQLVEAEAEEVDDREKSSDIKPPTSRVYTEETLLGFEMTASMVVWSMIEDKILKIPLTDAARDHDSIFQDLTAKQINKIKQGVIESFSKIFDSRHDNGRAGYLLWARNSENGFDYEELSELYKTDENFLIKYIEDNLEAFVYNGRRMTKLYSVAPRSIDHVKKRVLYPVKLTPRAKNIWKFIALGSASLAIIAPHLESFSILRALSGDFSELPYILDNTINTFNDPGGIPFLAKQSAVTLSSALLGIGSVYAISRVRSSLRATSNSPSFDVINYNTEIGRKTRAEYIRLNSAPMSKPSEEDSVKD